MTWSSDFLNALKANDVRLVSYVPDNVLTPLISAAVADNYFASVGAAREDEALGMVAGAWMGGLRGCVMMQTSGFGVIPNALASLIVPYQIPAILIISERGTLGEFNAGQVLVNRTMRPVLDSLAVTHHTITDPGSLTFVVDRSIKQAVATQCPVALILSPLLTGGKTFK
ncbi:MAG: decarboxylase [Rhizobiales bacterium]|nr:decarboxylase [Hyphomicrobiales bacterium]